MKIKGGLHTFPGYILFDLNVRLRAIIVFSLLGFLIYSNTFNASFNFDDVITIVTNPTIRDFWNFKSIFNLWSTRFFTFLTFAFNYHVNQLHVTGYHITNLVIHIGASLLVWWFILLTFSTPALKSAKIAKHKELLAFFGGLLFVSHPVQTEAVTYIFQRSASLAALFYLASLCLYVKTRQVHEESGGSGKRKWFYTGSLLTALFGMFTKETCFTLPFAILLYEFFFLEGTGTVRWKYLLPFFLFLPIIPLTLFLTRNPNSGIFPGVAQSVVRVSPDDYFLTQFRVIVTYLRLLFVPVNQNLDYDYPIAHTLWTAPTLASFVLLLLVLTCGFLLFRKYRILSFAVFFFFLSLAVESSFLSINDVIFEHRLYLTMVGYCLFLPAGLYYLLGDKRLKTISVILLVLITCYSALTYVRNRVWHDEVSLWSDVVRKSPNKARPLHNLGLSLNKRGVILKQKGEYDRAITDFTRAITVQPDYADAYNNRGTAHFYKKEYDPALADYNQAIRINPDFQEAYFNRGSVYYIKGEYRKAIPDFQAAIKAGSSRLNPYYNPAILRNSYDNLVKIYRKEGAASKVKELHPKISSLKQDADVHNKIGILFLKKKMIDQALREFKSAVDSEPANAEYYNNLGDAYMQKGERLEALKCWEEALRLDPNLSEAIENLNKTKNVK